MPSFTVTRLQFAESATVGAASDETGIADGLLGLDIGPKSIAKCSIC